MEKIKDINQGDILTFKAADGKYKVLLCTGTYKVRSPHNFLFAALTYDSNDSPTIEAVLESEFFGIGNRKNEYFKYSDDELEKMWTVHPEIKPYYLGSYWLIIWRKDFLKFRDNLELIGNIQIVDNLDKNGSSGLNASDWNVVQNFFTDNYLSKLPDRGQEKFKVRAITKN